MIAANQPHTREVAAGRSAVARLIRTSSWRAAGPKHSIRRRLIVGMGGLISLRAAFSGISFVSTILLARLLGPTALGAYSYSMAWIVLLAVPALLGMDQLLVREVAANSAKGDWAIVKGLIRWSGRTVLQLSCALTLAAGGCVWLLARPGNQATRLTFIAGLPFLPLISLTRVRQAIMQGLHRVSLGAMPEQLIQPGIFLLFLLAATVFGIRIGSPAAMLANSIGGSIAFGAGVILLRRSLPNSVIHAAADYKSADWFRAALPLVFVAGVAIVFAQADTLILGLFRDQSAVGIYSLAHKGSELVSAILMTQVSAFGSTAANLYALHDTARLQRLVTKLARFTLLASAPVIIGMIVFGRWYLLLYGPAFADARATLAILTVGQAINVATGCVGMLLVTTGHEQRVARAIGAGAVTNVFLSCALAPRWGPAGVAFAYASSMALWNIWAVIDLYRLTGIDSTVFGCLSLAIRRRLASNAVAS